MPFLVGHFNVHSLFQNTFLIPTHCNKNTSTFHPNPKFYHPLQKLFWKTIQSVWIVYTMVSLHFLLQLKEEWRHGGNKSKDMEQFGVTIIIVTMVCQGLNTMWTAEKHAPQIGWIVTNLAKMRGITKTDWPSLHRPPDYTECFAYTLTIGYLSFPLFISSIPVFREYDPCERVILFVINIASSYYLTSAKLVAIITLFVISFYSAAIGLVYILLVDSVVESFQAILPRTYLGNRALGLFGDNFPHSFHLFNQLHIVLNVCNQVMYFYLPILFSVGLISSIWGLYASIMLLDVLPVFIYFSGIAITVIVYALICLLAPVAAFPFEKSKTFEKVWKRRLFSKGDRMRLRSCEPLYFSVGPFLKISKSTTLDLLLGSVYGTINMVILNKPHILY